MIGYTVAICLDALFVLMAPVSMAESGRVISGGGGPTPLGTNPGGKYISRGGAMSRTQVGSTSSVAEVRNSTPILAASIAGMATRRRQPPTERCGPGGSRCAFMRSSSAKIFHRTPVPRQTLAYVRETRADADTAKVLTMDRLAVLHSPIEWGGRAWRSIPSLSTNKDGWG